MFVAYAGENRFAFSRCKNKFIIAVVALLDDKCSQIDFDFMAKSKQNNRFQEQKISTVRIAVVY